VSRPVLRLEFQELGVVLGRRIKLAQLAQDVAHGGIQRRLTVAGVDSRLKLRQRGRKLAVQVQ